MWPIDKTRQDKAVATIHDENYDKVKTNINDKDIRQGDPTTSPNPAVSDFRAFSFVWPRVFASHVQFSCLAP